MTRAAKAAAHVAVGNRKREQGIGLPLLAQLITNSRIQCVRKKEKREITCSERGFGTSGRPPRRIWRGVYPTSWVGGTSLRTEKKTGGRFLNLGGEKNLKWWVRVERTKLLTEPW